MAIDIGNSRTKAALFKGSSLLWSEAWASADAPDFFSLATNHRAENIILSSVAKALPPEERARLRRRFRFIELSPETNLPIANQYETPTTLGKDRIAAVVGAAALFPGQPCVVADAGTCMTLDLVHPDKGYLGGNIAPGIRMRLQAMHHFTARLPQLNDAETGHDSWYGQSTADAMKNGAGWGAVFELQGFRQKAEAWLGPCQVIATGGDASFLAEKLKSQIFVNPNLVLLGLNKILSYNVELSE